MATQGRDRMDEVTFEVGYRISSRNFQNMGKSRVVLASG